MKKYKGFQISWWLTFVLFILLIFGSALILLFLPNLNQNLQTLISQCVIIIPIIIGLIILKNIFPYDTLKNMLGIRGFNINFLIPLMLLPVCATFFISYLTAPINIFINFIFGEYLSGVNIPRNLLDFSLLLVSLCIVAPITEEILFRGILVKLLDRYGSVFTILMSSLAFSIVHFNPSGMIATFILGVIMCILRLGTESIFSSIMFHMTNNFFALMIIIFENDYTISSEIFMSLTIFLALMFLALMTIFLLFFSKRFYYRGTGEKKGVSIGFILTMSIFAFFSLMTAASNFLTY